MGQAYGQNEFGFNWWPYVKINQKNAAGVTMSITGTPLNVPFWKPGGYITINGQNSISFPVVGDTLAWSFATQSPVTTWIEVGTPVQTGGSWYTCDLSGGNMKKMTGKTWTSTVEVTNDMVGKLIIFQGDATNGVCGEPEGTIKRTVIGPVSTSGTRPEPPL
jgi:hypothetical protein